MNFTKRFVETAPVPAGGSVLHWDDQIAGLGLRIYASSKKTFFWSRRANKKLLSFTIGDATSTTLDAARVAANKRNSELDEWRRSGYVGAAPWSVPDAPTLNELIEKYKSGHVANLRKPERTKQIIDSQMKAWCSTLRDRTLNQITRGEIVALREKVNAERGKYAANRLLETLRAAINWGIEFEYWQGTNPAADIPKFPENSRERFLHPHEFAKLAAALDLPTTGHDLRDFTKLALYTGARKSDILAMNWRDIDLERRVWLIPQPKNNQPYFVALVPQTIEVLQGRLARAANDEKPSGWVFPSADSKSGHVLDMKKSWAKLRAAAGLGDIWIHDLRRTLGSVQAEAGTSLHIVGKSLGHKNTNSTQIYARLQLESVRKSVASAVDTMVTNMEAKPVAQLPAAPDPEPVVMKAKKAARRG